MADILIQIGDVIMQAELYPTPTAQSIGDALPLAGAAHVWGEEIYFDLSLHIGMEPDAREEVEVGELGYWPAGPAFCIFFGPTPVSRGTAPRAYSPVNVFGKIKGDPAPLRNIPEGTPVRVTGQGE